MFAPHWFKTSFAAIALSGAFAAGTGAQTAKPQAAAQNQTEKAQAPHFAPPADMPIPLPRMKPPAEKPQDPAEAKQNGTKADTGQNSAPGLPQKPPVPAPAPAPSESVANSAVPSPAEASGSAEAAGNAAVNNNAKKSPKTAETGGTVSLADAQKLAQNLADKFSQIRLMMGEFIQFDARGGTTTGTFYLQRPGKILFDYQDSPLRVICDGSKIAVNNRKLRSWSLYDLDKSPLSLLLADKITIANGRLLEFTQEPNAVIMVLGDATGRAKIRMIFDAKTYGLKQWTMTDNGQDTTVQIFNAKTDIEFEPNMFNINYYRFPKKR